MRACLNGDGREVKWNTKEMRQTVETPMKL